MSFQIFVSYSHEDATLVSPVVSILRATRGLVFHDADSIQPGKRWRSEIADALGAAQLVVVFWCLHSCESSEVKQEYDAALHAAKDVLPVLLDSTPLPIPLREFQWIDFRRLADHAPAPGPTDATPPGNVQESIKPPGYYDDLMADLLKEELLRRSDLARS